MRLQPKNVMGQERGVRDCNGRRTWPESGTKPGLPSYPGSVKTRTHWPKGKLRDSCPGDSSHINWSAKSAISLWKDVSWNSVRIARWEKLLRPPWHRFGCWRISE